MSLEFGNLLCVMPTLGLGYDLQDYFMTALWRPPTLAVLWAGRKRNKSKNRCLPFQVRHHHWRTLKDPLQDLRSHCIIPLLSKKKIFFFLVLEYYYCSLILLFLLFYFYRRQENGCWVWKTSHFSYIMITHISKNSILMILGKWAKLILHCRKSIFIKQLGQSTLVKAIV